MIRCEPLLKLHNVQLFVKRSKLSPKAEHEEYDSFTYDSITLTYCLPTETVFVTKNSRLLSYKRATPRQYTT